MTDLHLLRNLLEKFGDCPFTETDLIIGVMPMIFTPGWATILSGGKYKAATDAILHLRDMAQTNKLKNMTELHLHYKQKQSELDEWMTKLITLTPEELRQAAAYKRRKLGLDPKTDDL